MKPLGGRVAEGRKSAGAPAASLLIVHTMQAAAHSATATHTAANAGPATCEAPKPQVRRSRRRRRQRSPAALSASCQNTTVVPEPGNLELVRQAVLCLINRERAEHDEAPLQLDAQLDAAASSHSQEMVSSDYFAHVSPGGLSPVDRIQQAGYLPAGEVG